MNSRKVIMITGGQRCGKSLMAERMAESMASNPVYLATSQRASDPDFKERVRRHRERRGPHWATIEEPLRPAEVCPEGRIILVDCVTLWATNVLFLCEEDSDAAFAMMKDGVEKLLALNSSYIFVTNEVGLGGVSPNALQRHFADLQGSINQFIAERADEVYLVVSGIPVKIKG